MYILQIIIYFKFFFFTLDERIHSSIIILPKIISWISPHNRYPFEQSVQLLRLARFTFSFFFSSSFLFTLTPLYIHIIIKGVPLIHFHFSLFNTFCILSFFFVFFFYYFLYFMNQFECVAVCCCCCYL